MCIFHNGDAVQTTTVPSSEFCKVWGLNDIKIGDIIGERTDYIKDTHFAEPQMERPSMQYQKNEFMIYTRTYGTM